MWNLKNNTNELCNYTETDSQTSGYQWGKGRAGGGKIGDEIKRHKLL